MQDLFSEARPLVLVGCGKMGSALLKGWLAQGLDPTSVWVIEPAGSAALPTDADGADGVSVLADSMGLPQGMTPRAIVLAIKPQTLEGVLPTLSVFGGGETLFLSIAAGYRRRPMADVLGAGTGTGTPIIRAMPNTPAAIGLGIAAAVKSPDAGPEDHALAETLLAAVGEVLWIDDEAALDAVTALSGSGPAYAFHLVEAMAGAGVAAGLSPELAARLAHKTVVGAGALLAEAGADAATLRRNVTSPGGTTEAALGVLMDGETGLARLMTRAVRAAAVRAAELSGKK